MIVDELTPPGTAESPGRLVGPRLEGGPLLQNPQATEDGRNSLGALSVSNPCPLVGPAPRILLDFLLGCKISHTYCVRYLTARSGRDDYNRTICAIA